MSARSAEAVEALACVKTSIDSGVLQSVLEAAGAAFSGDQSWLAERMRSGEGAET
ncbi:MAG TPA: hypothetical protein VMY98_00020 [Anaerolineae bacterium]|nr:hypothetical protein [Anaerolineae bacterium]